MSTEHKIKFEYINSNNIESEVPTQQLIREPSQNGGELAGNSYEMADDENASYTVENVDSTLNEDSTVDNDGSTFVPVMTEAKPEVYRIENPMYSEVHSEVIKGQQLIREGTLGDQDQGDKKPKSRIPTLNFRKAAEKVRSERRHSRDISEHEVKLAQRRSSIPKLKKNKTPNETPSDTNKNNTGNANNKPEQKPPEDEFEKIYDEIIQTDTIVQEQFNSNSLVDTIDAKELEQSFEEIIHDYEENRVQPIDVKQVKSRIPLVKQKSLPEESVAKVHRRLSLKDINCDDNIKESNAKLEISGVKSEDVKINVVKTVKMSKEGKKDSVVLKKSSATVKTVTDVHVKNDKPRSSDDDSKEVVKKKKEKLTRKLSDKVKNDSNKEPNKEVKETIKIATPVFDNIPKVPVAIDTDNKGSDKKDNTNKVKEETPKLEDTNKIVEERPKLDKPEDYSSMMRNDDLKNKEPKPNDSEKYKERIKDKIKTKNENGTGDINEKVSAGDEKQTKVKEEFEKEKVKTPISSLKVSQLINRIDLNEQSTHLTDNKDFTNEIPKKKSILSKIAMFTRERDENDKTDIIKKETSLAPVAKIDKVTMTPKQEKIKKDSDERLKYVRSESVPLGKYDQNQDKSVTPPNSPHAEELEPKNFDSSTNDAANNPEERYIESNTNLTKDIDTVVIEDYDKLKYIENDSFINKPLIADNIEKYKENEYDIEPENIDKYPSITPNEYNTKTYEDFPLKNEYEIKKYDDLTPEYENVTKIYENLPLEALNKDLSAEAVNKNCYEDDLVFQGKVSSIINRIDSINDEEVTKKEIEIDVPITKSVSSRVAMFERQTSKEPERKPFKKIKPEIIKAKIVDETLKTQIPQDEQINVIEKKVETVENLDYEGIEIVSDLNVTKEMPYQIDSQQKDVINKEIDQIYDLATEIVNKLEIDKKTENIYVKPDDFDKAVTKNENSISYPDSEKEIKNIESKVEENNTNDFIDPTPTKEMETEKTKKSETRLDQEVFTSKSNDLLRIDGRLKTLQSTNNETNLRKTKSVAELDIGDAVKGKVHQLIVKMHSSGKIDVKKENINIKERPRKRSVLEKIALFESKLTAVEFESTFPINTPRTIPTATTRSTNIPTVPNKSPTIPNASPRPTATIPTNIHTVTPRPTATIHINIVTASPRPTVTIPTNNPTIPTTGPRPTATIPTSPTLSKVIEEQNRVKIEELKNAAIRYGRMDVKDTITLRDGSNMPVLALGTALMDPTLLPYIIGAAIDLGYRAFDTAYIYGNEAAVGRAIKLKIVDGTVRREELYIIGKLWSTFHRRELVESACRASLAALQLDYFDLYLVHNPMSFKEGGDPLPKIANVLQYSEVDYMEAWYGMEELVTKSLAKSIGVSNFNSEQIAKVTDKGRFKPVINQVECHPYLAQTRLDHFCADRNIKLMCFGVLGSKGTPDDLKANTAAVIDDAMIKVMASGLNITTAQLLVRYQIECGHAVVVKASTPVHMWENLQAVGIKLNSTIVDGLTAMNKNKRTYLFKGMGDTHRNYPFQIPF